MKHRVLVCKKQQLRSVLFCSVTFCSGDVFWAISRHCRSWALHSVVSESLH